MYCTFDDIVADIGYDDLQQITDDNNTGVADEGIVQKKIQDVEDYINSHIQEHYSLPITTSVGLSVLRKIAVSLVVCDLYQRRLGLEYPESLIHRRQEAISDLQKIQKGIINLQQNEAKIEKKYLVSNRKRKFDSELY
jgi:phage gp36-like protein